jgi:hypothetical protein
MIDPDYNQRDSKAGLRAAACGGRPRPSTPT